MKVTVLPIDQEDREQYKDFRSDVLEGRKKVLFDDEAGHTAVLYLEESLIEKLGVQYIEQNATVRFCEFFGTWEAKVSQNAYYNDPKRNPPRTVRVIFVSEKYGENTEVYRNVETGDFYLRMLCNEPFARWMTCDKRMTGYQDRAEFRPNITIENVENGQKEKVYYHDWNGTAAYADTFNPDFNSTFHGNR